MFGNNSMLEMAQRVIVKFNTELEQKNKEIEELQDKVYRLEELVFEMYDSWIKHNCCGRHD